MILQPEQPTLALHARNASESAHPELWRGLVGAWVPALGYQGGRLLDLAGRRIDGVVAGRPAWGAGLHGQYIEFDGVDDTVDLGSTLRGIPTGNSGENLTVSFWLNINTLGIANQGVVGTENNWAIRVEDGYVWFRTQGGNNGGGSELLVFVGVWVHIVCVWRVGSSIQTWANGVLSSDVAESDLSSFATNLFISFDKDGAKLLNGKISELEIYDRALTGEEIRSLYTYPLAPFRLRDDTALATAAMFGGTTTPSVTLPPPLFNMQMTGSF